MANDRIVDLPAQSTPLDTDLVEIVDTTDTTDSPEGTSKKESLLNIKNHTLSATTRQVAYDGGAEVDLNPANPMETRSSNQSVELTGITIDDGGTDYEVGQILTVIGGFGSPARFRVSIVSSGVITQVILVDGGNYAALPSNPVLTTGSSNNDAEFTLTFHPTNTVKHLDSSQIRGGLTIGGTTDITSSTLPSYISARILSRGGDGGATQLEIIDSALIARLLAEHSLPNGLVLGYNANTGKYAVTAAGGQDRELAYTTDIPVLPTTADRVLITDDSGDITTDDNIKFDIITGILDVYRILTDSIEASGPSKIFDFQNIVNANRALTAADLGVVLYAGGGNVTLSLPAAGDTATIVASASFYIFQPAGNTISASVPAGVNLDGFDGGSVTTAATGQLIKLMRGVDSVNEWRSVILNNEIPKNSGNAILYRNGSDVLSVNQNFIFQDSIDVFSNFEGPVCSRTDDRTVTVNGLPIETSFHAATNPLLTNGIPPALCLQTYSNVATATNRIITVQGGGSKSVPVGLGAGVITFLQQFAGTLSNGSVGSDAFFSTETTKAATLLSVPQKFFLSTADDDDTSISTMEIFPDGSFVLKGSNATTPATAKATLDFDSVDLVVNTLQLNSGDFLEDAALTGTLPHGKGGTGHTSYISGELLIGNGGTNALDKALLTPGPGISMIFGAGSITIEQSTRAYGRVHGTGLSDSTSVITANPVKLQATTSLSSGAIDFIQSANGSIQYTGDDPIDIMLHVSIFLESASGANDTEYLVAKNGTVIEETRSGPTEVAASGDINHIGLEPGKISLVQDDILDIHVQAPLSASTLTTRGYTIVAIVI